MSKIDRREFMKKTGALGTAAALLPHSLNTEEPRKDSPGGIPPHHPIRVPGVHAYAEKSIAAGDTVNFHVSATVSYKLSVCRLGVVDNPGSDEVLHVFPSADARPQPIHPGSYIHVDKPLDGAEPLGALSIECWVRPFRLDAWQGLVTQYNYPDTCGLGLFIDEMGRAAFYLGDGSSFRDSGLGAGPKLREREWHHIVGTWDGKTQALWLDGKRVGEWKIEGPVKPGSSPLRLGADGKSGLASNFLDGDLASPAIHDHALGGEEIRRRFKDRAKNQSHKLRGALGYWPLTEERGERVADASGRGRHGRLINKATWMIGGPSFRGEKVPQYKEYDPARDPDRGHALRFAADDLYDCGWEVTHRYTMPKSARSGLYVGRLAFDLDDKSYTYDVTFIVKKAPGAPPAPILVLCSSNTWIAYSATPFAKNLPPRPLWAGVQGRENSVDKAPAYCIYRAHHGGQPTYKVGVRMPWPVAAPDVLFTEKKVGYSHLMRGERFAHNWLDAEGHEFDVVTDYDLHCDPDMLQRYKVLVINGHSEYWTREAYEGVDRFLGNNGSVLALSGNTMFWRVTFEEDGSTLECRKYEPLDVRGVTTVGHVYHSHDGKRGSLMRECGHPAWKLLGLECVGWWGVGFNDFGVYKAERPDHFLFNRPERVGLAEGESFGHAPDGGMPRAGGHEADVRLSTLFRMTDQVPEGETFPKEPEGITTLARIVRSGTTLMDYYGHWEPEKEGVLAELIYWERPEGGRVFHCGTIGSGWALSEDPKMQTLMRNVLHHFGVKKGT